MPYRQRLGARRPSAAATPLCPRTGRPKRRGASLSAAVHNKVVAACRIATNSTSPPNVPAMLLVLKLAHRRKHVLHVSERATQVEAQGRFFTIDPVGEFEQHEPLAAFQINALMFGHRVCGVERQH